MDNEVFKKLVAAVRKEPALLHALAFEPGQAARKTGFIGETDRTMLAGMQAENLLAHALGIVEPECRLANNSLHRERHTTAFYDNIPGNHAGCTDTCVATCQGGSSCACTVSTKGTAGMERINPASARFAVSFYNRAIPGGMYVSCGPEYTCCCTSSTCGGVTCGGSTCDVTCSGDSCGNTCGNSCGYTTNITVDPLGRERLLAQQSNQPLFWK